MNKVEVVDKTTTTTTTLTQHQTSDTVQQQQQPSFILNSEIICSSGICASESECNPTSKTKQVLFDLDTKNDDINNNNNSTTNTNNIIQATNYCSETIRRLSSVSSASSKRSSNNNKKSESCNRKSHQQVELNMDSIVVAKSASSSSNSNSNSMNNRLRNLIEIFRNTFNTSSASSSMSSNTLGGSSSSNHHKKSKQHNQKDKNKSNESNKTSNKPCGGATSPPAAAAACVGDDETFLCQLCYNTCAVRNKQDGSNYMYNLDTCEHSFCIDCLRLYLKYQIIESRVAISCPQCSEKMHPNDIYRLLSLTNLITTIDKMPLSNSYFNTITGGGGGVGTTAANASPISSSSSSSSSPASTSSSSSSSSSSSETPNKKLISSSSTSSPDPKLDFTTKKPSTNEQSRTTPTNSRKPVINLQEQQQNWPTLIQKYEEFMLRRVLVTIADTRWCPAPDCTYAVIASGCANCPQLYCMRPGCNTSFCYHCKQYWHPNLTCEDAALRNNQSPYGMLMNLDASIINATVANPTNAPSTNKLIRSFLQRSNSHISTGSSNAGFNITSAGNGGTNGGTATSGGGGAGGGAANTVRIGSDVLREEIKRCPKCQALIVKMDDGSCNHITCAVCGCEFCWLCMKEISDLHYLSPSGCTFWGKKPWSRKKKILWQLGILIGAPVGIALIAGVAVPAILIGLPIWSGRKVYVRYKSMGKHKRNLIVFGTVVGTVLVAPLVAALAVGIGVPILLAYVYGVVPISLCRSGGCGVTTNNNGGVRFAFDDETTDNINFFTYNNSTTTNNNPTVNNNTTNTNESIQQQQQQQQTPTFLTKKKSSLSTAATSVKIPISAIESKPDNILMVRSSPHESSDTQGLSNETGLRPQTPVLVTITVANKSSSKSRTNSTTTNNTKLKQNSKVKRVKSATTNNEKKKHKIKTNLTTRSSSIATSCGSVELLKLNKTSDEFNLSSADLISRTKEFKSIAAELVNETGPISSSLTNKKKSSSSKLNNTTNTSDFEANLSSSSSSHHLIESTNTRTLNKHADDKENMHAIRKSTKHHQHQHVKSKQINPSIGEASIGAYTNTSLSADIIDVDDDDDDDDEEEEDEDEDDDEETNEDGASNFQYDQENSSTKAIASGSIKKYSIESTRALAGEKTNENTVNFSTSSNNKKLETKINYDKPIDTYSVSIISEKSINPSVAALAGSIKDNQSVDNLSATDDRISINTPGVQLKIN